MKTGQSKDVNRTRPSRTHDECNRN